MRTKRSLSPRGKLRSDELGASRSSSSRTSEELDGGRSELDVRVLSREPVLATDMLAVWSCWSEGEGFPVGDRPFLLAGRPGHTQRSLGRLVYIPAHLVRVRSYSPESQHAVLRNNFASRMAVCRQIGALSSWSSAAACLISGSTAPIDTKLARAETSRLALSDWVVFGLVWRKKKGVSEQRQARTEF